MSRDCMSPLWGVVRVDPVSRPLQARMDPPQQLQNARLRSYPRLLSIANAAALRWSASCQAGPFFQLTFWIDYSNEKEFPGSVRSDDTRAWR